MIVAGRRRVGRNVTVRVAGRRRVGRNVTVRVAGMALGRFT